MLFPVVKQPKLLGYRFICSIAVCLISTMATRVHADVEQLHAAGQVLRDARGGTVILRGLNLTGDAKVPPFRGIDDVRQLDVLEDWGVNVVRLLFTWEAFEPQRRRYDDA